MKMLEMSDEEVQAADELNDDFVLSAQGAGANEADDDDDDEEDDEACGVVDLSKSLKSPL